MSTAFIILVDMNKKNICLTLKRVFVVSLPFLAVICANIAVSANLKNFCLFRLLFHHECIGCGLTRAFVALCRFEFEKAYEYNPLIVVICPILCVIWIFLLKEVFKKSN